MALKNIMVDRTKLLRPKNYAKRIGLTERAVQYQIQRKEVATDEIDGVVFIVIR